MLCSKATEFQSIAPNFYHLAVARSDWRQLIETHVQHPLWNKLISENYFFDCEIVSGSADVAGVQVHLQQHLQQPQTHVLSPESRAVPIRCIVVKKAPPIEPRVHNRGGGLSYNGGLSYKKTTFLPQNFSPGAQKNQLFFNKFFTFSRFFRLRRNLPLAKRSKIMFSLRFPSGKCIFWCVFVGNTPKKFRLRRFLSYKKAPPYWAEGT